MRNASQPRPKTLRLRADALDEHGAGLAPHDGDRAHVRGLLPDEEANVVIEHRSPHTGDLYARIHRRHSASPDRVVPACSGYGRCGGCSLQHLRYGAQLEWKRERLAQALAGLELGEPVPPCVASPGADGLYYRSRVKLVAAHTPEGVLYFGAYAPRSHEVVDLAGCQVSSRAIAKTTVALLELCRRRGIRAYDERTREGLLRYVLLRDTAAGQVQVSLVVAGEANAAEFRRLAQELHAAQPQVQGVLLHENRQPGNVLLPEPGDRELGGAEADRVLLGEAALWDPVGPLQLCVSPRSFTQINREVAARLYADVAAGLGLRAGEQLLDVYCGIGGIGLTALALGAEGVLLGIEEGASAVADARAAAERAGLTRAEFRCGDARQVLAGLSGTRFVVALNPPRRGCDPEVLQELRRLSPRAAAYVSCSPETLARDLRVLADGGYRVRRATPYDMHPHTPHIEAVALLEAA